MKRLMMRLTFLISIGNYTYRTKISPDFWAFLLTLITALKKPPDWAVCLDTDNYLVLFLLVTASAILNNAENTSKIK